MAKKKILGTIKLMHAFMINVGHGLRDRTEHSTHDTAQEANAAAVNPVKKRT